jgi:hypothetical protein
LASFLSVMRYSLNDGFGRATLNDRYPSIPVIGLDAVA